MGTLVLDFSGVPSSVETLGLSFVPLEGPSTVTFVLILKTPESNSSSSSSSGGVVSAKCGEIATIPGIDGFTDQSMLLNFDNLNTVIKTLDSLFGLQSQLRKQRSRNISNKLVNSVVNSVELSIASFFDALYSGASCVEDSQSAINDLSSAVGVFEASGCNESCEPNSFEASYISASREAVSDISSSISGACTLLNNIDSSEDTKIPENKLSQPIQDQFLIQFSNTESDPATVAETLAQKYNFEVLNVFDRGFCGAQILFKEAPDNEARALELKNDPEVKDLVQDHTVTADSFHQIIPNGIRWIEADKNPNDGLNGVVAVLDTGIDFTQPDLAANIDTNLSRDFTGDMTSGNDNHGHGTWVAGIIAALDNGQDVVGVAPRARLVSVKVLASDGFGSTGSIIAGLNHVTRNANTIEVANLSLGDLCGAQPQPPRKARRLKPKLLRLFFKSWRKYLRNYDRWVNCTWAHYAERLAVISATDSRVIVVAAAGNESVDVTRFYVAPGGFPEVVSVSALEESDGIFGSSDDRWASYSNFGQEVDIIAPGFVTRTTGIGGSLISNFGTSFAAPHVSGTLSLYLRRFQRPSNARASLNGVRNILNIIARPRQPFRSEPNDGVTEPACFANDQRIR